MTAWLLPLWLTAFALNPTPPETPPENIKIRRGFVVALAAAQVRAQFTRMEEFYCLIGRRSGTTVWIFAVIKPKQMSTFAVIKKGDRLYATASNVHTVCPPGTVADFHTHPVAHENAPFPSGVDRKQFSKDPYRLHLIGFPGPNGRPYLATWYHSGDGETRNLRAHAAMMEAQ